MPIDYGKRHECHDMSESIMTRLEDNDIRTIFENGLHEFLSDLIYQTNSLSSKIAEAYNFD